MYHTLRPGDGRDLYDDQITRSIPPPPISPVEPDENTLLLKGIRPTRRLVSEWTRNSWRRALVLNVFPVAVVLTWCAVPFPTYDPNESPLDGIKSMMGLTGSADLNDTDAHYQSSESEKPVEINFWFFLFFYYGFYNAVALLMITKIFDLYYLNWWPVWLGGGFAYCTFWLSSLLLGVLIYLYTGLEKYNLTWVLLTFVTMNMPLLVAFIVIRLQNRNTYRRSLTPAQKIFLENELRYRVPSSYVRFLWFCVSISIVIGAFIAGEAYAYVFVTTPQAHTGIDAFVYVYSWLATIYILDTVTEYIIETRVKSYPLQFTFKLYFFMIYFIFYRNLFARLRNRKQYILIQAASSLWVCIFYPICMTRRMHKFLVYYVGVRKDYEQYKKQCGRSFFIRNLAENATMLGFICWICIIHYGPNFEVYPYFKFNEVGNEFNFDLTLKASCVIWAFELASNTITRFIYRRVFKHDISREAVKDFEAFPEMVVALIVIIIHVLQDMLMALLSLHFKGDHVVKHGLDHK
ncbi:1911_t:CDS:2 [Acaulospora colombiana]|uniref:1911_t:CDS:1 n=1 Tax=Acaulospora colombiana TaxID=27376 RepID=A0ACA9KTD1_9GLOM|nr:1911_t:CDS:2 [Acaulospora colombiana]